MKRYVLAGIATAALTGATLNAVTQINGAGATCPAPIYTKWFAEYNKMHPDVQINYQPLGSGAGIRQITAKTVFFGASDGPMAPEQLQAAPGKILHLPTVLGGEGALALGTTRTRAVFTVVLPRPFPESLRTGT